MRNHLKEILQVLTEKGVRFVICGGVAVVLHGVERMTLDLDLVVDMSRANLERLVEAMRALNLTPRVPVPPESLLDETARRKMREEKDALVFTFLDLNNPYRQVNIFLTDEPSYQTLSEDAVSIDVGGFVVSVASLPKLIEMKQRVNPPRDKDIQDIRFLTKRLKGDNES
ncbi:MAG: nucleotidyl transferase AbiEii/AbiGii toxin family protein [Chloroherpetonaceae bacterium]|nr:nucleotidyl transferase AbiEii/AbiGii toxin family protein [Chloroherpetonaceae bacterium]